MFKVIVKDLTEKEIGGFQKETIEEVNEYLSLIDLKYRPWHQTKEGEYSELPYGVISYTEEYRIDDFGNQQIFYIVPKHYTAEIIDLDQDYDYQLQECYRKRIQAYGTVGDQLDEQFKNFEAWKARIAQVKLDNPKPVKA